MSSNKSSKSNEMAPTLYQANSTSQRILTDQNNLLFMSSVQMTLAIFAIFMIISICIFSIIHIKRNKNKGH